MIRTRRFLTFVALGALPLAAQHASDLEKELEALLNTPIQGASKREQRLIDSPQAIEVLTGDEIRAMGVYKLVDALKLMTSVDVLELNNHVTNIALRGAMQQGQPRTVQILIDGVPLYNAVIASVDIDNLPLPIDLIDKIEVVRGPSSSLYGANAVVGVLAITTRRAKEGTHGLARGSRADKNTWRGAGNLEFGEGPFGLAAGYQGASLGATNHPTTNLSAGGATILDRDASHQRNSFARADWKYSDKGSVWFGGGEAYKYVGLNQFSNFPYQTFVARTANAGWSAQWREGFRTELRWSHFNNQYAFGPAPSLVAVFSEPGLASEYTWMNYGSELLELQVNWDPSQSLHVVGGLDRRKYSGDKSAILGFPTDFHESASGGFLNVDWNVTDSLTLNAGARVENESIGGSRTSPRAAIVWNPDKSSSLRAGYYSSTRSPQLVESRVNFQNYFQAGPGVLGVLKIIPNVALEPEKVTSTEVGYRRVFGAFSLDATVFEMKFTKLIAQIPLSQTVSGPPPTFTVVNQWQNTGDAKDRGIELAGAWRASNALSVGANATWLDYKLTATDKTPSYTPKFKANAWVKGTYGPFSFHLAYQHVGKVDMEVLPVSGPAAPPVERSAIDQASINLAWECFPGASLALYSRNALKEFTDEGGGGPTRAPLLQPVRRETGVTLSYRF
jgi:iron complex outermembrane receptor protein